MINEAQRQTSHRLLINWSDATLADLSEGSQLALRCRGELGPAPARGSGELLVKRVRRQLAHKPRALSMPPNDQLGE